MAGNKNSGCKPKIVKVKWEALGEKSLNLLNDYMDNPDVTDLDKLKMVQPFMLKAMPEKIEITKEPESMSPEDREKALAVIRSMPLEQLKIPVEIIEPGEEDE